MREAFKIGDVTAAVRDAIVHGVIGCGVQPELTRLDHATAVAWLIIRAAVPFVSFWPTPAVPRERGQRRLSGVRLAYWK